MGRIKPISSYTGRNKPGNTFLVTEALDFLMTESGDYLVTKKSSSYTGRNKPTTIYS